jgi:hypothetical protein
MCDVGLQMPSEGEPYSVRFLDGPFNGTVEVRISNGGLEHEIGLSIEGTSDIAWYVLQGGHGSSLVEWTYAYDPDR